MPVLFNCGYLETKLSDEFLKMVSLVIVTGKKQGKGDSLRPVVLNWGSFCAPGIHGNIWRYFCLLKLGR